MEMCRPALTSLVFAVVLLNCGQCQDEVYIEYEVLEEQSSHTFIGNVASDAGLGEQYSEDVLGQLRFAFLIDNEYFEIEGHSGVLWTAQSLDRDSICPYSASCELRLDIAVQPVRFFQIIKIRIQLQDLNDNWPTFDQERISLEISETTTPGATFALPSAQDLDSGQYGVKSYALRSSTDTFDLQVTEGTEGSTDVHLVVKDKLDREGQDFYTLTLIASDRGIPPKTGSVAIDVAVIDANDNNPRFSNYSYEVYINENVASPSVIITLQAYDPDEGENGQIVYEFSRNTQDAFGHLFSIDEDTGKISVIGDIDHEVASEYSLSVVARDRGPSALAAYTKVVVKVWDINDHAPQVTVNTMTPSGNAEIMEGATAGTFVAHISVSDPDGGRNGEFTCILDNRDFQLEKLYQTEFKMTTTTVFDREAKPEHFVNIICEDNGRMVQSSTRTIPVIVLDSNDHAPVFSEASYTVLFQENNVINKFIIQVNATDEDLGLNADIRYTVYDEDGFESSYVHVDDETGVVKARVRFDYEQRSFYQFVLKAVDQGEPAMSATATLSVQVTDTNDEPPRFYEDMYHFRPMEHQAPGAEVGTVEAYDMDTFPFNKITYSLSPASPDRDVFDVHRETGLITTRQELDREARSKYMLIVAAENQDYYLSTTVVVAVLVGDLNDNTPEIVFPSVENNTAQVSVSAGRGDEVTVIEARDLDVGPNGALSYKIIRQDVPGLFHLDPVRGVMSANRDLKDYADQTLELIVQAEDHGTPRLSSSKVLNVVVNSTLAHTRTHLLDQTLVIIICLAIFALVLILAVILVVALVRRKREQERRNHRYNCRVEATKALVAISTENNKSTIISNRNSNSSNGREEEGKKKEVSFNLRDNFGFGGERQRPGWPANGTRVANPQSYDHAVAPPRYDEVAQLRSAPQLTNHRNSLELAEVHNQGPHTDDWQKRHSSFREEPRHRLLYQGTDKPLTQLHLQVHDMCGTGRLDPSDSDRGSLTDSGRGPSEEGDHSQNKDERKKNKCAAASTPSPISAPDHHGNSISQGNNNPCDRTKPKPSRNCVYPAQSNHHRNNGCPSNQPMYPVKHWGGNYLAPPSACRDVDSMDGMSDGGTTTSGSYVVDPDEDILELEDGPQISTDVFV